MYAYNVIVLNPCNLSPEYVSDLELTLVLLLQVSMASKGPNTNKSQFFITYSRQPHLNNVYTVFGKVGFSKGCDFRRPFTFLALS